MLTINIEDLDDYTVKVSNRIQRYQSHRLSNATSPTPSANDTKSLKFKNQKKVFNSEECEPHISPIADTLFSANGDNTATGKMRCSCVCSVFQKQKQHNNDHNVH